MILMCHLVRKAEYGAHTAMLEAKIAMLEASLMEKKQSIATPGQKKQGKQIFSLFIGNDSHSF